MEFTAQQIADMLEGVVVGDPQASVNDVSKIEEGRPNTLTFFANAKYEHYVYTTEASVIIVNSDFEPSQAVHATMIKVPNAYESLAKLLSLYQQMQPRKTGIEQPSHISPTASVGKDTYVGAFAYIGDKAKIGDGAKIYPQAYVGDGVSIGADTIVYPGAKIYKGCKIGARCVVHSGAVIGADGFGFAPDKDGVYHKIEQVGIVVVEDDVEIGANTCIDRSTMGNTRIGRGVKLDDLVMVAHNVVVGHDTVIASQSGIAGSTKIGSNCVLGGQVGVAGHIEVADRTTVAAQSGIQGSVKKPGQTLFGSPAFDYMSFTRAFVVFRHLPELKRDIDTLMSEREANKR